MLVGVVWALPSRAHNKNPEKIFSLNVPTSVPGGAVGVSFPLKFVNETPSGNSSVNSLKANVTAGVTITHASAPSGTVSWTGSQVSVSNMYPVKNGQSFMVTLTLSVAPSSSCGTSSVTWDASAWTGSWFTGSTFRLLKTEINPKTGQPYSQLVTQVNAAICQLRFVPGRLPANGIKDTPITAADGSPVQVELIQDGSPAPWFTGTVTISATSAPPGATLSGASVSATAGVASFPALSADSAGDYTVQASALSLTSDSVSFSIFFDGIFCGDTVSGASGDGTSIDLTRTDSGGGSCDDIPYTLTVTRDLITLLKDEDMVRSQGAQFEVAITWAEPVGEYPDFGETEIDIDGDGPIPPFVPDNCVVVDGVPQYPENPNSEGDYYPAPGTVEPWCVSGVDIQPSGDAMIATEHFLGSGDPNFQRK
jgi:hypothetical protein